MECLPAFDFTSSAFGVFGATSLDANDGREAAQTAAGAEYAAAKVTRFVASKVSRAENDRHLRAILEDCRIALNTTLEGWVRAAEHGERRKRGVDPMERPDVVESALGGLKHLPAAKRVLDSFYLSECTLRLGRGAQLQELDEAEWPLLVGRRTYRWSLGRPANIALATLPRDEETWKGWIAESLSTVLMEGEQARIELLHVLAPAVRIPKSCLDEAGLQRIAKDRARDIALASWSADLGDEAG